MATVLSINISPEKGTVKQPVPSGALLRDHGIDGDAHAGNWRRQVSLLASESIDKVRGAAPSLTLSPGIFAENITTEGIILHTLPVGTRLRVGEAELEITQIGKECHNGCEIRRIAGDCVMPREGVFAIVVQEACIRPGDVIDILPEETP